MPKFLFSVYIDATDQGTANHVGLEIAKALTNINTNRPYVVTLSHDWPTPVDDDEQGEDDVEPLVTDATDTRSA